MDFFFYFILGMILLLCPIFLSAKGTFLLESQVAYFRIKLCGIPILRVRIFLSEEGIFFSLNGKKGKKIESKKKGKLKFSFLDAVRIRLLEISVYAGGAPQALSPLAATLLKSGEEFFRYLTLKKSLDEGKIRFLPCYTQERGTVNFSIRLFTSIALLLSAFTHTTKGDKYAKRSNRKFDG